MCIVLPFWVEGQSNKGARFSEYNFIHADISLVVLLLLVQNLLPRCRILCRNSTDSTVLSVNEMLACPTPSINCKNFLSTGTSNMRVEILSAVKGNVAI